MADEVVVWLEGKAVKAFQELYPGNISQYGRGRYVAAATVLDKKKAAIFLGTVDDEDFYLDWFYVIPECRRQGIGSRLLEEMVDWLEMVYGVQNEYTVCPDEVTKDYFRWKGFQFAEKNIKHQFTARLSDMIALPKVEKVKGMQHFSELSDREFRTIELYFSQHPEIPYPLSEPVTSGRYLPQSMVFLSGNVVKAMIVLEGDGGAVAFSFVYTTTSEAKRLMQMLSLLHQELAAQYGEDLEIKVTAVNDDSLNLTKKLLPKAECREVYFGTRNA